MSKFDSPLNNIRIASPCSADWNEMYGDDRKRFCGDCKLHVYNLSGMTRDEAEALVMNAEGRLCVRFYRRADGSVLTENCPVGWAKVKQRTRIFAAAAFSMVAALFTGVLFVSMLSKTKPSIGKLVIPFSTPTPRPLMGAIAIQGNVAIPSPTPQPQKPSKFEMGKIAVRVQDSIHKDSWAAQFLT